MSEKINCPYCQSVALKRTFLGGSGRAGAIVIIILGGIMTIFGTIQWSTPGTYSSPPIVPLIWLIVGILGFSAKKYKCTNCGKRFS